jgi:hypothetical protein
LEDKKNFLEGFFMRNLFRNYGYLIVITVIIFFAAGCPDDIHSAPTDLTATVNGKIITLSWKEVKNANDYIIYGSFTSGGPFVHIGNVSFGTAFYVISMDTQGRIPLEPNTTYYFKVEAYKGELSSEVSATTGTW